MDTVWAAEQIERHPWVKEASVSRSFPSTVNIEIQEYTPTLLLALERMWYVDTEGDIFRAADSSDVNHPILTGIPSEMGYRATQSGSNGDSRCIGYPTGI